MDIEKLFDSVQVLYHSSIRIAGERVVYVDPFGVEEERHDAGLILITHDHYDHFSPEDIQKVRKADTVLVTPASTAQRAAELGCSESHVIAPGQVLEVLGLSLEAVAAYNPGKPYHPGRTAGWGISSPWAGRGTTSPGIPTTPRRPGGCGVTWPFSR